MDFAEEPTPAAVSESKVPEPEQDKPAADVLMSDAAAVEEPSALDPTAEPASAYKPTGHRRASHEGSPTFFNVQTSLRVSNHFFLLFSNRRIGVLLLSSSFFSAHQILFLVEAFDPLT